ncbi:MAG: transcriptional repressor LexA [Sphaerochaetaceae bacterium]|jgi:repressor LexA
MKELTERQREIATFISEYLEENSYAPSVRDIAEHFQISAKAAHDHVKALERKQVIRTAEGLSRSMEVISQDFAPNREMVEVPLLGDIAAGSPIMSEENWNGSIMFPAAMLKNTKDMYYALRVRGESMIGVGIYDGDLAIIRHCASADPGDIVVASVGENSAITLKRFFLKNNMVELRAENPEIGPIFTNDCQVHGKLYMIVRNYEEKAW